MGNGERPKQRATAKGRGPGKSGPGGRRGKRGRPAGMVLQDLAQRLSAATGEAFFRSLVEHLAAALDVEYVLVGALSGEGGRSVQTRAVVAGGRPAENFTYALADTPCEDVVERRQCCYPRGVRERFPRDRMLDDLGAESYVGTALVGSAGRPLGLVAALGRHPLQDPEAAAATLEIFAARAAAELERLQAEEALRHSEALHRQVVAAVHGGVVTVAPDGSLREANAEAQRLLGLTWDELARKFVPDFEPDTIWEDGSPCPAADYPVSRCLATGRPAGPSTIGVRRPDGQVAWAEFTAIPVLDPADGRLTAAVVTFFDITERKRSEEALREKEARLRLLVEQAPAILWTTDRELRFTSSLGAGLAPLGLRPNQVVGTSLYEFFRTDDPGFLPIAASLRAVAGGSVTYEMAWGGRVFQSRVEPFHGAEGQVIGTIGTAFDITERKRAEEALRESEERHRLLAEVTSDFTYGARVGPGGDLTVETASPALSKVLGYSLDELNARGGWASVVLAEDLPVAREGIRRALTGERGVYELRARHRDGDVRWLRYSIRPVWDGDGRAVVRVLGAVQDVTAQRQAREQLQALSRRLLEVQEQERRYLARELHDEIGQALTGLHLTLEAGSRLSGTELQTQLGRARALVKDLTARVRDLSLRLRPTMLDDLGLLPALLWHFERYTAQTGVRVTFEHHGLNRRFPGPVETAAYRIVQEALTNVARHAGVAEAAVRLRAGRAALLVEVEDRGRGFARRPVTAAASSSGLSGMKERATLLGGRFAVASRPGRGTRLTARLPLHAGEEEQA